MGGGKGIPILMFTPAIVGIGVKTTNAKNIAPESSFFILLPPLSITDAIFPLEKEYANNIFHHYFLDVKNSEIIHTYPLFYSGSKSWN